MPASTRSQTPAATAAADQPSTSAHPPAEEEVVALQTEVLGAENHPQGPPTTPANPSEDRLLQLERSVQLLLAETARQKEEIEEYKTALATKTLTPATREEKEAADAKLLESYPVLAELKEFWPESHSHVFPTRSNIPAKPFSLELFMEQADKTWKQLYADKKDGQRADYTALTEVFVWAYTFTEAINHQIKEDYTPESYAERYARFFNGVYDALALAADRLGFIQVKTLNEFEDAFRQVLEANVNHNKISNHIFSPNVAALHGQFVKLSTDKAIAVAAKRSAQFKIGKAPNAQQPAGEKPNPKRAARKKPEERPAPQA